jgi:hypothetical protein
MEGAAWRLPPVLPQKWSVSGKGCGLQVTPRAGASRPRVWAGRARQWFGNGRWRALSIPVPFWGDGKRNNVGT